MAKIVFNPSFTLIGPKQEDDFAVSFSTADRAVPATPVVPTLAPGCLVTPYTPAFTATDVTATFSGSTQGAYLKVADTANWEVVGTTVRKRHRNAPNTVDIEAGNRFNRRTFTRAHPYGYPALTGKDPGVFDYNSLAAASTRLLHNRLAQAQPGATAQDVFLDGGDYTFASGPSVTPNPNRILPDLDLSGVSVTRTNVSGETAAHPVMLVSPRHIVCNSHIDVVPGNSVAFRRRDGTIQTATVLAFTDKGSNYDLRVAILSEDITNCAVYKTLPDNWASYLPACTHATLTAYGATGAIPVVVRQANTGVGGHSNPIDTNSPKLRVDWIRVADTPNDSSPTDPAFNAFYTGFPQDPLYPFYQQAYGGDSGSPMFVLVPNSAGASPFSFTPALASNYFGATSGPFLPRERTWVNAAMQTLSTAQGEARVFTFNTVDLSLFPTYE